LRSEGDRPVEYFHEAKMVKVAPWPAFVAEDRTAVAESLLREVAGAG
jgi:hypothetical protein